MSVCNIFLSVLNKFVNPIDHGYKGHCLLLIEHGSLQSGLLYSYLVGCCSISDLFGKGESILGEA